MYQTLPDIGGKSPVFSVNLVQIRAFANLTSAQSFSIQVTIGVSWTNGKRTLNNARVNLQSGFSVTSLDGGTATTGSSVVSTSTTSATTGSVDLTTGEAYADSAASLMASLFLVVGLIMLSL